MKYELLTAYVLSNQKQQLRDTARRRGASVSAEVRRALAAYLGQERIAVYKTPGRDRVLAALRAAGGPISIKRLASKLNIARANAHVHVRSLLQQGLIRKTSYGRYEAVPRNAPGTGHGRMNAVRGYSTPQPLSVLFK